MIFKCVSFLVAFCLMVALPGGKGEYITHPAYWHLHPFCLRMRSFTDDGVWHSCWPWPEHDIRSGMRWINQAKFSVYLLWSLWNDLWEQSEPLTWNPNATFPSSFLWCIKQFFFHRLFYLILWFRRGKHRARALYIVEIHVHIFHCCNIIPFSEPRSVLLFPFFIW